MDAVHLCDLALRMWWRTVSRATRKEMCRKGAQLTKVKVVAVKLGRRAIRRVMRGVQCEVGCFIDLLEVSEHEVEAELDIEVIIRNDAAEAIVRGKVQHLRIGRGGRVISSSKSPVSLAREAVRGVLATILCKISSEK